MSQNPQKGRLIGVGTGPGDPELLTLKAVRALQEADVVAFFAKRGSSGNARAIVAEHIRPDVVEFPMHYPVTTEIDRLDEAYGTQIDAFYEASAAALASHLDAGQTVAILSEGDPLFYGSYMHLHVRLSGRYPTQVIPGVTAMSGCWSQAAVPIVQGDDVLTVLPGVMDETEMARRLADTQAAIIMKVGSNLPKIRRALADSGRLDDAIYVERGTMAMTRQMRLVERPDEPAPYFSIILVPGWATRRGSAQ